VHRVLICIILIGLVSLPTVIENPIEGLTMKRSEILQIIEQYKKNYQRKYRFSKIGIFGSAARGTAGGESDIDIVIEQKEPDLFLLGSIKTDLENELGSKVDIIRIRKGMNAFLKDRIERETIYV